MKVVYGFLAALSVTGCVTAGYEGQVGSYSSSDQILAQREANRSISVFSQNPSGYTPMGEIAVRRCHRSFTEDPPNIEAITDDLQVAAYGRGADAISDVKTEKLNGLAANCWYVLEGTAQMWRK